MVCGSWGWSAATVAAATTVISVTYVLLSALKLLAVRIVLGRKATVWHALMLLGYKNCTRLADDPYMRTTAREIVASAGRAEVVDAIFSTALRCAAFALILAVPAVSLACSGDGNGSVSLQQGYLCIATLPLGLVGLVLTLTWSSDSIAARLLHVHVAVADRLRLEPVVAAHGFSFDQGAARAGDDMTFAVGALGIHSDRGQHQPRSRCLCRCRCRLLELCGRLATASMRDLCIGAARGRNDKPGIGDSDDDDDDDHEGTSTSISIDMSNIHGGWHIPATVSRAHPVSTWWSVTICSAALAAIHHGHDYVYGTSSASDHDGAHLVVISAVLTGGTTIYLAGTVVRDLGTAVMRSMCSLVSSSNTAERHSLQWATRKTLSGVLLMYVGMLLAVAVLCARSPTFSSESGSVSVSGLRVLSEASPTSAYWAFGPKVVSMSGAQHAWYIGYPLATAAVTERQYYAYLAGAMLALPLACVADLVTVGGFEAAVIPLILSSLSAIILS